MKKPIIASLLVIIFGVLAVASSQIVRQGDSAVDLEKGWPLTTKNLYTDGAGGPVVYTDWFNVRSFLYNFVFYLVFVTLLTAILVIGLKFIRRKSK